MAPLLISDGLNLSPDYNDSRLSCRHEFRLHPVKRTITRCTIFEWVVTRKGLIRDLCYLVVFYLDLPFALVFIFGPILMIAHATTMTRMTIKANQNRLLELDDLAVVGIILTGLHGLAFR